MPRADAVKRLCVAIHDVAPATWSACEQLICMVEACGGFPLSLLVVPDYHGRGTVEASPEFCRAINGRLARGDEILLHGYRHLDDAQAPVTPWGYLRRRVYTAGEGEFGSMDGIEARRRLAAGSGMLARLGWPVDGFVAPAWLLGNGAWDALGGSTFSYTAVRRGIYSLPQRRFLPAPTLVYSTRSRWRRRLSRGWNERLYRRLAEANVVRVALHPADAAYPEVMAHWANLLGRLKTGRLSVTKRQLAALL